MNGTEHLEPGALQAGSSAEIVALRSLAISAKRIADSFADLLKNTDGGDSYRIEDMVKAARQIADYMPER